MNANKMNKTKGTPLTKDEVRLLIQLIETEKAVTSKTTNYANNQMKDAAWLRITGKFNASVSSCPRTTAQLRLKWENLKKAARNRSASMRQNQLMTGGGKLDDFPPDDSLDRVASLLGTTCDGYTSQFGGDSEPSTENLQMVTPATVHDSSSSIDISEESIEAIFVRESEVELENNIEKVTQPNAKKKIFFSTPSGSAGKLKRKAAEADLQARTARNNAIAEYYKMKAKKLQVELACNKSILNKPNLENTKIENNQETE